MKIDSRLQTIKITCNLYDGSCGRQLFSRRLQCTQRNGFPTTHSSPVQYSLPLTSIATFLIQLAVSVSVRVNEPSWLSMKDCSSLSTILDISCPITAIWQRVLKMLNQEMACMYKYEFIFLHHQRMLDKKSHLHAINWIQINTGNPLLPWKKSKLCSNFPVDLPAEWERTSLQTHYQTSLSIWEH